MVLRKAWVLSRYGSVFYESRGLEVSLSVDLCVSKSRSFFLPTFLRVSDLLFLSVRLVFRSRIFSELIGI